MCVGQRGVWVYTGEDLLEGKNEGICGSTPVPGFFSFFLVYSLINSGINTRVGVENMPGKAQGLLVRVHVLSFNALIVFPEPRLAELCSRNPEECPLAAL